MPKEMDGSPLTYNFANGHEVVIQVQGRFTKRGLPRGIPADRTTAKDRRANLVEACDPSTENWDLSKTR